MKAWHLAAAASLAAFGLAPAARAAEPRTLPGAGPALTLDVAGPVGPSETFAVAPALPAALRETALEETVRVTDWPVAPGDRRTVEVTRHDVYSPDARIVAIGAGGETEVPRSRLHFFWGTAAGDSSRRVLLSLDPDTGTLGGLGVTPDGIYEVRAARRRGEYRIARPAEAQRAAAGGDAAPGGFTCGGSPSPAGDDAPSRSTVAGGAATSTLSSLHTATVAVDTDNELMKLKFADSTASATSYLVSLFAGMNLIYERDLFVRLLQGHTILRLSSAADPWTLPACPAWPATCQNASASSAQLGELSTYWATNYAAVPRALAVLLSGKQSSNNIASGIAWLDALCSGAHGYSFSQVFKFAGSTAADDVSLVAHEIGHNFGSGHTHCYPTATTPIDRCYMEGGCYSGPTACPAPFTITPINGGPVADVRGTLMSYCHLLDGCSASPIFHPQTVDVIAPIVDGKVNVCVFASPGSLLRGSKTVSGTFTPGGQVAYAIVLSNTGGGSQPDAAGSDELVDVLPSSLALVSATATAGTATATPATRTVVWNGSIASGGSVTVTIQATIGAATAAGTVVSNQGTVRYDGDGNGTNESSAPTDDPGLAGTSDATVFTVTAPPTPSSFYTLPPCRLVDTRGANGPAIAAGAVRTFTLAGACGLPSGAKSVSLNVTVVAGSVAGNVVVYPGDLAAPSTSTLNSVPGVNRANFAIVGLATNGAGTVAVKNRAAAGVHVVLDTGGYFQ